MIIQYRLTYLTRSFKSLKALFFRTGICLLALLNTFLNNLTRDIRDTPSLTFCDICQGFLLFRFK